MEFTGYKVDLLFTKSYFDRSILNNKIGESLVQALKSEQTEKT